MNRFDIPTSVCNLLNKAVSLNVLDAVEVYALSAEFGSNWHGLVTEICETAFCGRHGHPERHAEIVKLAEACWQELPKL